jgi:hypothetical protein
MRTILHKDSESRIVRYDIAQWLWELSFVNEEQLLASISQFARDLSETADGSDKQSPLSRQL